MKFCKHCHNYMARVNEDGKARYECMNLSCSAKVQTPKVAVIRVGDKIKIEGKFITLKEAIELADQLRDLASMGETGQDHVNYLQLFLGSFDK